MSRPEKTSRLRVCVRAARPCAVRGACYVAGATPTPGSRTLLPVPAAPSGIEVAETRSTRGGLPENQRSPPTLAGGATITESMSPHSSHATDSSNRAHGIESSSGAGRGPESRPSFRKSPVAPGCMGSLGDTEKRSFGQTAFRRKRGFGRCGILLSAFCAAATINSAF